MDVQLNAFLCEPKRACLCVCVHVSVPPPLGGFGLCVFFFLLRSPTQAMLGGLWDTSVDPSPLDPSLAVGGGALDLRWRPPATLKRPPSALSTVTSTPGSTSTLTDVRIPFSFREGGSTAAPTTTFVYALPGYMCGSCACGCACECACELDPSFTHEGRCTPSLRACAWTIAHA